MSSFSLMPSFTEEASKRYQAHPKEKQASHILAKYTHVSGSFLEKQTFPENTLVFLDGKISHKHSTVDLDGEILYLPLEEAFSLYGSLVESQISTLFQEEKNPYSLYTLSQAKTPLFFHIEEGKKVSLQIVYVQTTKNALSPCFMQWYLGKNAVANISTSYLALDPSFEGMHLQTAIVSLEEKAELHWIDERKDLHQKRSESTFRALLKKEAKLYKSSFSESQAFFTEEASMKLSGEKAHAELSALLLAEKEDKKSMKILMEHISPEATSSQLVKTVAAGSAKTSFSGKIYVHPEAQKTDSYQLNQSLLLSDKASIETMPNLEIFADDVKASHGATVSECDDSSLFYLQSRGLSKAFAKELLTKAFCEEVLQKFPKNQEVFRESIKEFVNRNLNL